MPNRRLSMRKIKEVMRKCAVAGGPLSEAISKIASSTENIKKHHIEGGKR